MMNRLLRLVCLCILLGQKWFVTSLSLNMTKGDIKAAVDQAEQIVKHRLQIFQPQIYAAGVYHNSNSASWFMSISHKENAKTRNVSVIALISEEATQFLAQKFQLTKEQIVSSLPTLDLKGTILGDECPLRTELPCEGRKFRAYNGFCNNVQHPSWGAGNNGYLRLLRPNYEDGVGSPRMASDGNYLPSSRSVSLAIHGDADRPHAHLMAMSALWAEFVAKDISFSAQASGFNGSVVRCCGVAFEVFHSDCYPIRIGEDDPFYRDTNCQEYVRSCPAPKVGCTLGPREQMNQASAFLDGSLIYGQNKKGMGTLRAFEGGLLKTQGGPGGQLLPPKTTGGGCRTSPENYRCFETGDNRVNEHIGLSTLVTLFVRQHNALARELSAINEHWDDETTFQESRRILIAQIQHITYAEFLPVILGQETMTKYDLRPLDSGFYQGYDMQVDAGIFNSVGTAALWYFASLMPKTMPFYDSIGRKVGESEVGESFYAPFDLYRAGILDQLLRGLIRGKAQAEDQFINEIMTNRMFEDPGTGLGLDLAAQLIQQGRDHGLPGYIHFQTFCGGQNVSNFSDLASSMPPQVLASLQRLYSVPEDIDLFTGGLSELPLEGGVVGKTFACLLALQFMKLRKGDRFWYENELPPSAFTLEQLNEIRKTSLARIICDNSNSIGELQPSVFLHRDSFLNAPMECEEGAIKNLNLKKWAESSKQTLSKSRIKDSLSEARVQLFARERNLSLRPQVDPLSFGGGFNSPKAQALEIANTSFLLQFATESLVSGGSLQDEESGDRSRQVRKLLDSLQNLEFGLDSLIQPNLPKSIRCGESFLPCDHTSKFRSITGFCNNLKNFEKGKAFTPFSRLLPPAYDDGLKVPRTRSKSGSPLPSPRLISTMIHDDVSVPHPKYSLMLMQFGQLLDHDLTHSPINRGARNSILDCSSCDSETTVHPECWPISIPGRDAHFPAINQSSGVPLCLPFTRSLPGQLKLGSREQLNQVSGLMDASFVYGSDICEAAKLRSFEGGTLNVTFSGGKPLLPQTSFHPECKAALCFQAGDLRASEQPALAALHTIFLRAHNSLANELSSLNPLWDDQRLYSEARRILSALNQHITFSEFLPRVLGRAGIHDYELELEPEGYSSIYDPDCDPSIYNEFATAAFRFGHSLLPRSFSRLDEKGHKLEPSVALRSTFFNPGLLHREGMIDELMRGLASSPMESLDAHITEEVTNHLFELKRSPHSGMDLVALNVQRGRDHGLPGYNEYRVFCNLTRARSFEDLRKEIPPRLISMLKRTYGHVDDIDLFPGGLAERPLKGGLVGPTFSCIIGKQFKVLRKCDRFWYESGESDTRFSRAQLEAIRKVSLASLLCQHGERIQKIQKWVMELPEPFLNPLLSCASLDGLDLRAWKEREDCEVKEVKVPLGTSKKVSPCISCTCTKEGPLCVSLKITNCLLLVTVTPQALQDPVCQVQCALSFNVLKPVANSV